MCVCVEAELTGRDPWRAIGVELHPHAYGNELTWENSHLWKSAWERTFHLPSLAHPGLRSRGTAWQYFLAWILSNTQLLKPSEWPLWWFSGWESAQDGNDQDVASIPGWGAKSPHAAGLLSPRGNYWSQRSGVHNQSVCALAGTIPHDETKAWHKPINKKILKKQTKRPQIFWATPAWISALGKQMPLITPLGLWMTQCQSVRATEQGSSWGWQRVRVGRQDLS